MSNEEFENYLALVTRLLRLNRSQREMIRSEMRDHLESRVEEMVDSGVDRKDAVRSALEEFGDAAGLANQFQIISNINQRRWMMRFATFSIIGAFVAAIFIMAMWPGEARFGAPSASIAQDEPFKNNPIGEANTKPAKGDNLKIDWDKRIRDCLKQEWSPNFDETSFIEVMDQIANDFKFNIILDDSAREDSLTEDTPVTFKLTDIPLKNCIKFMLMKYNATFIVRDDVLRVISIDVASDPENFRREIIDCSHLLRLIAANEKYRVGSPVFVSPIERSEKVVGDEGQGGGGFGGAKLRRGGGGVFSIVSAKDEKELAKKIKDLGAAEQKAAATGTPQAKPEQPAVSGHYVVRTMRAENILEDLVRQIVDPEGWDVTNGDGTMQIVAGCIVVLQSEPVIAEIHSLIDDLTLQLQSR